MQTIIPENIAEVSNEDMAKIEAELVAEFDALLDGGSTDVALMTEIADAIEAVRAEQTARAEAEIAAAQAVAALAERVHVAEPEAEIAADPEADEADEEADEAEAIAEIAEDTTINAEAEEADAEAEENELVTASADKTPKAPSASAVARRSSKPEVAEAQPEVVITAAADIPGYSGGATISTLDMAKAMHAKARTLSNHSGFVPVATVNLPIQHKVGADMSQNLDVIAAATAPEALTAAGWCAPSQNLYTLFGVDAGDGLLDLPTVQVTRGGLNVPEFLGIGDASGALWEWTEESAGDEQTKQCLYIPCPEFTDYRLKAEGLCLTNGNLTDRAFPELTSRFIALAINAHLHRLSAAMVNDISLSATGVTVGALASSAAGSILHAVDLQVADYRSQYRMSVNSVLEAVFPLWAKEVIRADFALRTGVNLTNVTDQVIEEHFAARKVRAQFVHDYQPLYTAGPAATQFPTTIDFLLYPAGGYIKGDGGTIDLGVVRDSVLNATNDYTAAWTEQLYLVAQVGPKAREVTVTYAVDGVTGCCEPAPAV